MRLPAFLALAAAPLFVLAAACVDGATPDCTKPNSGCVSVPTEASTEAGDSAAADAASDAPDATSDASADAGLDVSLDAPKLDAKLD